MTWQALSAWACLGGVGGGVACVRFDLPRHPLEAGALHHGLTLAHFSAQLEPCLTTQNTYTS